MKLLGKAVRAMAIALALVGGSIAAKPAKADGGAVIAGIAGGLILGSIIGSTANANTYYSQPYYGGAQTYYAPPAPRYYAPAPAYRPYYGPTVSFNVGSGYYGGHKRHYGKRHYGGHKRHYRGHRGYNKGYRRAHRRHHRRHH